MQAGTNQPSSQVYSGQVQHMPHVAGGVVQASQQPNTVQSGQSITQTPQMAPGHHPGGYVSHMGVTYQQPGMYGQPPGSYMAQTGRGCSLAYDLSNSLIRSYIEYSFAWLFRSWSSSTFSFIKLLHGRYLHVRGISHATTWCLRSTLWNGSVTSWATATTGRSYADSAGCICSARPRTTGRGHSTCSNAPPCSWAS